jgi:hypothetical protein
MDAKKMFCELCAGLIAAVVGFGLFWALLRIPWLSRLDIYLGGDKASVFIGLFLGIPVGGVLGIFVLDKVVFKAQGYNLMGIAVGLALSLILGGIGTALLMSKFGGQAVFVAPLVFVIFALIGYTIALHK